ncbi:AMMECR1 family protein [Toxoplasma gondii ARI]|uniref:AMMECR1 family protein n=1 Tax=Toxoplasma gondii ARI TaxID=1074872 RepID=A0A139XWX5_TOXGO|nr:AMMECR1 family protein [Toxoplasma gondii ARI]
MRRPRTVGTGRLACTAWRQSSTLMDKYIRVRIYPQVMVEFEMKANDIAELIRKAQYFGEITEELLDSVQLTKFQGTHGSLSFSEHKNEHGLMTGVTCSNGHVNGKQSRKFSGGTERHR